MTLASRLRCKSTARFANYQDFLQKNCRKISYNTILLHRLCKFHSYSPFSHYPAETRFYPFLSPLMAFEGVSCYQRTLRPLKNSTIGSCSPPIFRFPRSFLKKRRSFSKKRGRFSEKRWTFSKKRGSFFSAPSERRFLTANRNTNKAGNGRAASLEVQPLIARIDNFQAWTRNYNITRAWRKFTQQRRR